MSKEQSNVTAQAEVPLLFVEVWGTASHVVALYITTAVHVLSYSGTRYPGRLPVAGYIQPYKN